MALYHGSLYGEISGEALGVVGSSTRGTTYIKKKVVGADPRTAKQENRRSIYAEFCDAWRAAKFDLLSDLERSGLRHSELFQIALSTTLKNSTSPQLLKGYLAPMSGSLPAPVIGADSFIQGAAPLMPFYPRTFINSYDSSQEYELFSASYLAPASRADFGTVGFWVKSLGKAQAEYYNYTTDIPLEQQPDFPTFSPNIAIWYVNLKTGQVSKPVCCSSSGASKPMFWYPRGR